MENWAICRDVVALVGLSTPAGSLFEAQAGAAVVMRGTAAGNRDACPLNLAPREAVSACALAGLAIVTGLYRAVDWQSVTCVDDCAESCADFVVETVTAVVVGVATAGDINTCFATQTP